MAKTTFTSFDDVTFTACAPLAEGKHTATVHSVSLLEGENSQYFSLDCNLEDGRPHSIRLFPFDFIGAGSINVQSITAQHPTLEGNSSPKEFVDHLVGKSVDIWKVVKYSEKDKKFNTYYNYSAGHELPKESQPSVVPTEVVEDPFA